MLLYNLRQTWNSDAPLIVSAGELKGDSHAFVNAAVIFAALVQGAAAQSENVKTDPMDTPSAENSAESEALMNLLDFAKHLEVAGYKDIAIVPQTDVVQAKDKFGNPIAMIVNTEMMIAVQLQIQGESETTGSGSSDETQSLWEKRDR
jgi:hypothetical protein